MTLQVTNRVSLNINFQYTVPTQATADAFFTTLSTNIRRSVFFCGPGQPCVPPYGFEEGSRGLHVVLAALAGDRQG